MGYVRFRVCGVTISRNLEIEFEIMGGREIPSLRPTAPPPKKGGFCVFFQGGLHTKAPKRNLVFRKFTPKKTESIFSRPPILLIYSKVQDLCWGQMSFCYCVFSQIFHAKTACLLLEQF